MTPPLQNILIFEDDLARSRRFLPLTYTRPLAELRSGAFTGIERVKAAISRELPDVRIHLHTTKALERVTAERHGLPVNRVPVGPTLLLNARSLFQATGIEKVDMLTEFPEELKQAVEQGEPVNNPGLESNSPITALWDIVHQNSKLIELDTRYLVATAGLKKINENELKGVLIAGEVYVHLTASIGLGVVLDATDGPIVIEEGARIMPNSTIMGPVVIGKRSLVKASAKIYEGTSIGPVCKVGGEIEKTIVQGYSNKQHDGYLGHAFLGEWVNLGADTNTSDLKNDYSNVRVTIEDEEFDSKSMFVGLLMGDHSKSAINSQFNTGTAVGVSCNVFDSGFPPKWIPNFSWGGASGFTSYRFDKAIKVAKIVASRRNVDMSEAEESLLRSLSENANKARATAA